ncbi:hypothetical protein [Bacillus sp. B-jedd]|uniref:hypothetical protein n=1 Tax=Bacillus sp. B-jedd TaxID=1476857 RepID=UPI0005156DE4|nr:hypothetical protein [Bacillus sp. B-jedd]CEG25582.1 group-specific protein [Bacillus sp. B-jedd]
MVKLLEFLVTFLADIFAAIGIGYGSGLNTKKIDAHIELLEKEEWFRKLYNDEKYRRLFFANKNVRGYLQNKYRVNRLIENRQAQEKFINLLEKQLARRKN